MKDVKVMMLEGEKYVVAGELENNGVKYINFAKFDSPEDFCIRKISVIDEKEMIVGLDNGEEFDMALEAFSKKYANDLGN